MAETAAFETIVLDTNVISEPLRRLHAAICVTNDAALCTRNSKDFVHYPSLTVIDPWAER